MLHKIISAIQFFLQAQTKYNVHSPLVFEFINEVLEDSKYYYHFKDLEYLRSKMLDNQDVISVEDFGAGSLVLKSKERKIAQIAASSLTKEVFCQVLFKMVHHYKPKEIIELGTSLGLATLYMSKAAPQSRITTIEGSEKIADVAQLNFDLFKANNISIVRGNIDHVLPDFLAQNKKVDFAFLDGNHQKEPTIRYFQECLKYANPNSIFIFDDIYWSKEMTEAWAIIKNHPATTVSIDLYQFGIIFINPDVKEKQHFKLISSDWKPFNWGFF